jgi:hypothetical protein
MSISLPSFSDISYITRLVVSRATEDIKSTLENIRNAFTSFKTNADEVAYVLDGIHSQNLKHMRVMSHDEVLESLNRNYLEIRNKIRENGAAIQK